ncbi:fungal-specific transcription factor domain-containing protein [Aspergillus karnatakaensis]|uniref:putative C6 transcription factor n=1 Tax=Aspergillus karnatakaensis TaxID=1810916 RepID=UPI003CCD74A7
MESSSSSGGQLLPLLPRSGPPREVRPLVKNKKSSTACLPCKRAKRKCTGKPSPCAACSATGAECVFNELLDLRRKAAAHQAQTDLLRYQKLLWDLIGYLRASNDERVNRLLDVIRAGGEPDEMEKNITTILREGRVEDSPLGDVLVDGSDISSEDSRFEGASRITVENLSDNPLFRVPCKPWTVVTDDDQFVSSLISSYFTWDHPLLQVVDQESFLRDMGMGDLGSDFCSPLLVNSVLAVACTYLPYPEVFAVPGDTASQGQHFFNAAETLWRAEEGQPSLTNIQALTLMSHNLKLQGKDNASWLYLRLAVQLGQDIGMFKSPTLSHSAWDQMSDPVRCASARTAWSIFIMNSQLSMESRKTANLEVPRLSLDMINKLERDTNWIPVQIRTNEFTYLKKPALLRNVMAGLVELTEIIVDMQSLFLVKAIDCDLSVHELCREASSLHDRLLAFLGDMAIIENPPVPQVLFLHIKCHQVIDALFGFLLEHREFESSSDPSIVEEAKLSRLRAALQIAHYLQLYHEHYGPLQTPSLMFGPAKSSALTLLPFLTDESILDAYDAFSNLCRILESFSSRFPAAKIVVCDIIAQFRDSNIALPFDVTVTADSDYS